MSKSSPRPIPVYEPLEPRRLLTTWYVDAASPAPTPTGSSWSTAYPDLQFALSSATSGDTIRVAQGTYNPTATTDRTASFHLKSGVSLYGGYAGYTSPTPDARDTVSTPSILSGDIGTPGSISDNSYHIIYASLANTSATLDGFTVTAGNANGPSTDLSYHGGGVYCSSGSPTIRNCTFTQNSAGQGGAIFLDASRSRITNCTFTANSAHLGGALLIYNSSSAVVTGCVFVGNSVTNYGGAVFNGYNSTSTVSNSTFVSNSAYRGGGYYNENSSPKVANSIFWDNSGYRQIYLSGNPFPGPAVTYSDIQGGQAGTGNLSADPRFHRNPSPGPDGAWGTADDDYGDLRLLPGSPCIDAGSDAAVPDGVTTDLAGRPRVADFPEVGPAGAGVVDMGAYEASAGLGELHVAAGQTVTLPAGGYAFTATRLIVDPGGTLDLADDSLLIDYDGASPLAAVRAALASGRNGGTWDGAGITSSAAAAAAGSHHAIGYTEATSIRLTSFAGRAIDGAALLLKYTLAGDANLDGRLDADDFALADRGRARGGFDNWVHGDFDYDAAVTDADLAILGAAFAPPPAPAPAAATVPPATAEPDTAVSTPITAAVLTAADDDQTMPAPPPAPAPAAQDPAPVAHPHHAKHHKRKAKHVKHVKHGKHVPAARHQAKAAKHAAANKAVAKHARRAKHAHLAQSKVKKAKPHHHHPAGRHASHAVHSSHRRSAR